VSIVYIIQVCILKVNTGKLLSAFSDAGQIASWAKDAMTLMVETGTGSDSGGKLAPEEIMQQGNKKVLGIEPDKCSGQGGCIVCQVLFDPFNHLRL
jgi:NAD-dependent dihydropyrimidine dehydrogenase PreA subunit